MIALVPLDNRPCNLRFPQQIATIGGNRLVVPPQEQLGFFNTPGSPEDIAAWLERLPTVQGLIVSIDMLAYGGLVASRRPLVHQNEALERLKALVEFRKQRPDTPIYAFNVLMRLAITLDSDQAISHYYNVMRYARLVDEAERFKSEYLREELYKVQREIPSSVMNEYTAARARNHTVNRQMIDWLSQGVFDYLLITQEDATEFGLHRREQDDLLARVKELGVEDKFSLHPGADEAGLTLLARHWNTGVRLRVHWSDKEDAGRIAPFEDRPYDAALGQHVDAMCGVLLEEEDEGEADFEFFVNAPVGGGQNEEKDADRKDRTVRLQPFVHNMLLALEEGRRVALCDVAFPNGADNTLMSELERHRALGKLATFAGWNTAGNTTGTVLALCAAIYKAEKWNEAMKANGSPTDDQHAKLAAQFLFERLIDDWAYQSRVRTRIEKVAREQNLSPLRMDADKTEPLEAQTRRELRGFAQLLAQRQFQSSLQRCDVTLPWHRTFEVDLRATLT